MASTNDNSGVEIEMTQISAGQSDMDDTNIVPAVDNDGSDVDKQIPNFQMYDIHAGTEEVDIAKSIEPATAPNAYIGKRNFIHQLMDVALMMANVSQLKALIASENNPHYYLILTFICLSISLQVAFTVCMLIIWSVERTLEKQLELKPNEESPQMIRKERIATWLDRTGSVLVLFIIVSNVFIAGFGIESHYHDEVSSPE